MTVPGLNRTAVSLAAQCLLVGFLAACTPIQAAPARPTPSMTSTSSTPTITTTALPPPTATSTALPSTATPTPGPRLCSPLAAGPLPQLTSMMSNPFHPPPPGSDDPHQAIDLAVSLPGSQVAVAGSPVQAALAGSVAGVIHDRFPYGNAILVETPLEQSPQEWWAPAGIPTPAPTLVQRSALTCPASPALSTPDPARRSLYVLYAHLQQPPGLKVGEPVTCGQPIGEVGSTGNALNPHLHFETRVGPAGMQFSSLAHYDASASPEEMSAYCLWRISGLFQLVDPNRVLQLTP